MLVNFYILGMCLAQEKNFNDALIYYDRVLEFDKNHLKSLFGYGFINF